MTPKTPSSEQDLQTVITLDDQWNEAYQQRSPAMMAEVLADDWFAFLADGTEISKSDLLTGMVHNPPVTLAFERHAVRVYGDAALTRGTLYADQQRVQSFLRLFAKRHGVWQAVSVQVVP